ncbi:GNAT family N-acetyltransferase [Rhodovulum euryhalinum]|uniref:Ribosomal protein S18 acetylase RimI-like enzyme n=1 Tax=Rhodovulum euryhalinum TaxID=35805 RepID=A0A4R2KHZ1_9RHOB|nr:GNAT family N-acetyltransferase [Rhodovulum euryhalinum]TCO70139.1 ribosomal protein S18 acetylase RimI-like enzyme [Rhodovulum euryhalinum]
MNTCEKDFSDPSSDSAEAFSRDPLPVRSMLETDLPAVVAIDRKLNGSGEPRTRYYEAKLTEMLGESGVRVSLVAEIEGEFAGFVMARVDYGEYGRTAPSAVLDTIGVEPAFQGRGVAAALLRQLLANLASLNVETLHTRVDWNAHGLMAFFETAGFTPSQRLSFCRPL